MGGGEAGGNRTFYENKMKIILKKLMRNECRKNSVEKKKIMGK